MKKTTKKPILENLSKLEEKINKFGRIIFSEYKVEYPNIIKAHNDMHHLQFIKDDGSKLYVKCFGNGEVGRKTHPIINENDVKVTGSDTLIFCFHGNVVHTFYWGKRFETWNYISYILEDDGYIKLEKDKQIKLPYYIPIPLFTGSNETDISIFEKTSLVMQALVKGRARGTQKSNKNSDAQRARGAKTCKAVPVICEWDCPNGYTTEEKPSMLDGYKLAVSYGYDKSIQAFSSYLRRNNKIEVFNSKNGYCFICSLAKPGVSHPVKTNNYIKNNKENKLINNNNVYPSVGVKHPEQAQKVITSLPDQNKPRGVKAWETREKKYEENYQNAIKDVVNDILNPTTTTTTTSTLDKEYQLYYSSCETDEDGLSYALSYDKWEQYYKKTK